MYNFNKRANKRVVAIVGIILVFALLVTSVVAVLVF